LIDFGRIELKLFQVGWVPYHLGSHYFSHLCGSPSVKGRVLASQQYLVDWLPLLVAFSPHSLPNFTSYLLAMEHF
jgi:hypothetical protein